MFFFAPIERLFAFWIDITLLSLGCRLHIQDTLLITNHLTGIRLLTSIRYVRL